MKKKKDEYKGKYCIVDNVIRRVKSEAERAHYIGVSIELMGHTKVVLEEKLIEQEFEVENSLFFKTEKDAIEGKNDLLEREIGSLKEEIEELKKPWYKKL